ncbi:MAG TPA: cation:proton antiporter [Planctomycetaceae bacterium]|jgi:CPA2 family monovalent cation:H+ antiporter-2|nr:cation:proton antiporter [Planctomycetaceae bacterium]
MHENFELILTLTGAFTAALLLGYATYRAGLSPIVGYLLAGVVVGPRTPGFVADAKLANELAEVGVILLMFGVGLHFHLKDLLAVRRVAVPGALGQILVTTLVAGAVEMAFGGTVAAGLVFGLAISVASTVVLLRVLADHNDLHTPVGHIAVGWLVVEDLVTVLVLVMLPVVFRPGAHGAGAILLSLGASILKIGLLLAVMFYGGRRLIPWLLAQMAATRSRELFTLTVLVLALGIALAAAKLFGASMALGAFLAGMVVGQSDFSLRAASEALPLRDAFAVLFFVSVGMLFHPAYLLEAPGLVAATLSLIVLVKPLVALGIVLGLGYPLRCALGVGVALGQIGEFSFILAELGRELGILDERATNTLVVASIVSISLNPMLYRLVDKLETRAKTRPRLAKWLSGRRAQKVSPSTGGRPASAGISPETASFYHAVIVGYGPVGRTVARLLRENSVEPTIVELNLETVRQLRASGMAAVYGDATRPETLQEAGIERAIVLVIGAANLVGSAEVIRLARELNPGIRVFARTNFLREMADLKKSGADVTFADEGEVALSMIEVLLRQLGATGEQLDRERDRIRQELFGGPLSAERLLPADPPNDAAEAKP